MLQSACAGVVHVIPSLALALLVPGCGSEASSSHLTSLCTLASAGSLSIYDVALGPSGEALLVGSFTTELRVAEGVSLRFVSAGSADGFSVVLDPAGGARSGFSLGGSGYDELRIGRFVELGVVLGGAHSASIDLENGPDERWATRSGGEIEGFLWLGSSDGRLSNAHVLQGVIDSDSSYFQSISQAHGGGVVVTAVLAGAAELSSRSTTGWQTQSRTRGALKLQLNSNGEVTQHRLLDSEGDDSLFRDAHEAQAFVAGDFTDPTGLQLDEERSLPALGQVTAFVAPELGQAFAVFGGAGVVPRVRGVRAAEHGAFVYGDVTVSDGNGSRTPGFESATEGTAGYVLKVNEAVELQWARVFDGASDDAVTALALGSDGTAYVTGSGVVGLLRKLGVAGDTELVESAPYPVATSAVAFDAARGLVAAGYAQSAGTVGGEVWGFYDLGR